MKSLWKDSEAKKYRGDALALRVYTSQLLGREPDLVLHGGGNTSVKAQVTDLFGVKEDVLFVKGSGWDLGTIQAAGFAPVKMSVLLKMARLQKLSDTDMVKGQRAAMTDPNAPTPSVEAILHAIIPFRFVDHTHADDVVAVSNSPGGEERIRQIYGRRVLVVPYVMPGFILARKVYEMTRGVDWRRYEGMVLLHHGIFSFADEAKESYERMIRLVTLAQNYLKRKKVRIAFSRQKPLLDCLELARLRQCVSRARQAPMLAGLREDEKSLGFANLSKVKSMAPRGPLTPDHVIRTKISPVVLGKNIQQDVLNYAKDYLIYFNRHKLKGLTCLDPAPRWAVWPKRGVVGFGRSLEDVRIINDIIEHTIRAIQSAEALGGWRALPEKDFFEVEYWELEQAKLAKGGKSAPLQGKIALVTGAASGIGRACAQMLQAQGAVVAALDINKEITKLFNHLSITGMVCDVTDAHQLQTCVEEIVRTFGGLDIVVSNAGSFPASEKISELRAGTWQKSLNVNLTSHQILLQKCIPYLSLGIDPTIIVIASKNVPAPGPGAAAYSVAKAGLTQLARVAALELAASGIRVNVVHPNAVFDTAIWTKDILEKRARHYGMTIDEYRKSNLLKVEITSRDVAQLVCTMAGPVFAKTTGAQIPIDGGNDRVI